MLNKCVISAVLAILLLLPGAAARAEGPVAMGAGDTGSSSYAAVLAIARAANSQTGLDLRPRPFKSTTQAVSFVDSGELEFGLESALGLSQAFGGTGVFEGSAFKNLRLVGTIYPYRVAFVVRDGDPARSTADLKGRQVPVTYRSAPNITSLTLALLAAGGLARSDVDAVDVATSGEAEDLFLGGSLTAILASVGGLNVPQIEQAAGPLRFLSLDAPTGAEEAARAFVPSARAVMVEPAPELAAVVGPTTILEYDYFVYASVNTPDEVVVGVVKALTEGKDEMAQLAPSFERIDPARMVIDIGVPYHPAAEAYYREQGLWPSN